MPAASATRREATASRCLSADASLRWSFDDDIVYYRKVTVGSELGHNIMSLAEVSRRKIIYENEVRRQFRESRFRQLR